jgi:signal transduction histidine kinase
MMPRRRRKPRRSRSVRTYVVRLVVAVTLPLLAFGAFLLARSARNEQQAIATTADGRAEGAAADLDRELRNLQNLISIVAVSSFISDADFMVPHHAQDPLLDDRALGLVVRNLSGQLLFNTCDVDGRLLPISKALGNIANAGNGSSEPYFSDLVIDPISGASVLTIDLLIWRENKPAYILSLCAVPRILQILIEQHLPDGWTAIVADREGRPIASTPSLLDVRSAATRGDAVAVASAWGKNSIENVWDNSGPAYRASYPVDLAGWTVAINVPNETFFGPVRRSLLTLLIAGGGTTALVIVLALSIGRRIAGPMADLTGIARALGSGAHVVPPLTGINEADLVAQALCSTSEDLGRRTEELTQTVEALRDSEKQLHGLSDDLRQALDERTKLLKRMVSAQEDERQRVARELHDQLGQYFAAMLLGLDAASKTWKRKDEADQRIAELKTITSAMSREVHQLSWELRPTALDDLGLELAIANYLEKWSDRFNLSVDFAGNLQRMRLSAPIEITLYRVLQEAMTNVAKHANAARISVVLEADIGEVRLIVDDDGTGFVQGRSGASVAQTSGYGLIGMRERLALVGGSLVIEASPGHGTTLFCRIPA